MQKRNQFSDIKTNLDKNNFSSNNTNQKNNSSNNNKVLINFNAIINNLKISLEKFDSSIRELKSNIDKDKEENVKKIQELEKAFNSKINSLNNNILENQEQKNKNDVNISPQILNKIISKINILEQNSKKLEFDFNTKLSDYENKNQIILKKIVQKINEKTPEKRNSLRKNRINPESPLSKDNEDFEEKMKILDEKIQILNSKVINLEIKSQNKMHERSMGDNSSIKDTSFNEAIISDKFDKKIQNLQNNFNNKLIKLVNKIGNIDLKDIDIDDFNINNKEDKNNDLEINETKELDTKIMDENSDKLKIINKEIENKDNIKVDNEINHIKKDLVSNFLKENASSKDNSYDINNKIISLKSELSKIIEERNNHFENKIKALDDKANNLLIENKSFLEKIDSLEAKLKTINNKISIIDNKFGNKINDSNMNNGNASPNSKNLLNENSDKKNSNENLSINILPSDKSFNLDTNILNKEDINEDFFLFSKIKETFPYNMTIVYKLIYSATKHGDKAKDFHKKCDYIGPNLILIKTKNKFIFGGVTSKSWKHLLKDIKKEEPEYGTEIKDEKAFGFSINLKKIYPNGKPNEEAIFCNNNYGPVFKNIYFKIFDECLKNGGICGTIEESNFIGQDEDYEFNGGEEKFEVEEIEIFQIGFK